MLWLRRLAREYVVVSALFIAAAFTILDGAGLVEAISGYKPAKGWLYPGVFILFAAIVVIRLVRLQVRIDATQERIRFSARPGTYALNYPIAPGQPLPLDEVSIETTIYFEIWTDIDVDTAKLVLNVVSFRRRRWWQLWNLLRPKSQRVLGIRIEGQDDPRYRRQLRRTERQPFEDHATFKWRGKREIVDRGGQFRLELALETGSPHGIWRAIVHTNLFERGATTPL
ncbi:MAG: hypothetical protein Q7K03_04445 [Dehalococcoidia bacterium]|nr:hypothetical protein [Dehalococcoidia bacterium]